MWLIMIITIVGMMSKDDDIDSELDLSDLYLWSIEVRLSFCGSWFVTLVPLKQPLINDRGLWQWNSLYVDP